MSHVTFHQARQLYKFANETENKSRQTVEWYDGLLARFEAFLTARPAEDSTGETPPRADLGAPTAVTSVAGSAGSAEPPVLAGVGAAHIRAFIAFLQGKQTIWEGCQYHKPVHRPLSPETIRGHVSALSAFFHWAVREGLIARNPMENIARPKVPDIIKDPYTEDEVKALVDACRQYPGPIAARNHCIVLFLADTGVRASELVGLTLDNLDLERGWCKVRGKGARDREVKMGRGTRRALAFYIVTDRPTDAATDRVFVTREGQPMTKDRLQKMLRDLGARAGVAHCHPHRFRHTAARAFLRFGGREFELQRQLGHASLAMTRKYVKLERRDIDEAYERASPVDNWGLK